MKYWVILFASWLMSMSYDGFANVNFKHGQVVIKGKVSSSNYKVIQYYQNADLSVVSVVPGQELKMVKHLRNKGKLAHVNVLVSKFSTPNDPFVSFQWNWNNINAFDAWQINTGSNATIAVLDTGLASNPVDGINCVVSGYNVYAPNQFPEDGDGHGTHVSGTISQSTNNNTGVAGLAYNACIMPVKVLNDSGSGGMAEIAEGIYAAVNQGANVINMSLGINARYNITSDPILDPAIEYAYNNNVTLVAASGNDGNRKNVSFPASHPLIIAVGATDYNNGVVRYSNKGRGLDIVAPGGDTSTDANGDSYVDGILQETYIDGSWGYYFFQGTSMASPHVAALAAMIISNGNASSPAEVKQALQESALDLYETGWDKTSGAGLIDALAALNWMPGVTPPPSTCTDGDGDGVCVEDGDCDDSNSSVFPGANDVRGKKGRDGIDNDCDGIIDG